MSGAGTNSGINYQQRMAALALVAQFVDFDLSSTFRIEEKVEIESVHFETDDPIDDLKLICRKCIVFLQIKRTLSLQTDQKTDFYNVIDQFLTQFLKEENSKEYYVLVTTTNSSNTIIQELSKITESIRLNEHLYKKNPLNKSEKNTFDKYEKLFNEIFLLKSKKNATEIDFIKFSQRFHIAVIEIEEGMPNEQVAKILLSGRNLIDTHLVWSALIANSLEYARKRQSVNKHAIEKILQRYIKDETGEIDENENLKKLFNTEIISNGSFPVGKEVVMVESIEDNYDYLIMELYRFSDDSKKKHDYYSNKLKLEGIPQEFTVIQRAATFEGLLRFVDQNEKRFKDKKIASFPSNPDYNIEDEEKKPVAELHKKYLQDLGKKNKNLFTCIHCEKGLNIHNSTLVEIDDLDSKPAIGAVHDNCLRPIDRIIGKAIAPSIKSEKILSSFDYKTWARLLMRGQGMFNGLKNANNLENRTIIAAWSANEKEFRDYSYCLKVILEDDSILHVTDRGRIHRFNKPEAEEAKQVMIGNLNKCKELNDPICYTDKNHTFGNKSRLEQVKGEKEKILEIKKIEISKYSKLLEKFEQDIFFYAPICILRHFDEETIITFNNLIPLISNPLEFKKIFNSWRNFGFDIPIDEVELKIIKSDLEFDSYMREFFSSGMLPIVDPVYDLNGKLISGIHIRHREQMMAEEHEDYRTPVENPNWIKGDKVRLMLPTITDNNYPEGIVIEDEFKGEDNQLFVIFRPIENGEEMKNLAYAIPSSLLDRIE